MAWYILRDERKEPTTKNTLPSNTLLQIWWRNQKLSRQAKVKRIQHHRTSFITNAKGTSLGRKHKRRKRPTENTPKTIKKTVIESHIYIYIYIYNYLKCKWIKRANQRHRLAGWMKTRACIYFHLPHHCVWPPQIACNYFILN